MPSQSLDDYFSALERLKKGTPKIVPKGTKITNDAVALEAGRGKGSIKKSRLVFADLIAAIEQAAQVQASPVRESHERLTRAKALAKDYQTKWEAALVRELCLLREMADLKKTLAKLTGDRVLPIRGEGYSNQQSQ